MVRINVLTSRRAPSVILQADSAILIKQAEKAVHAQFLGGRTHKSVFGDRKNRPGRTFEHAEALRDDAERTQDKVTFANLAESQGIIVEGNQ
jgi:hypothetical protein